jgi:putative glutamine amidotransferase
MIRIALTDPMGSPAKAARYPAWITRWIPGAEVCILSYSRDNLTDLDGCAGLVLSGGGDVDPLLYHRPDVLHMVSEVDRERDGFELKVIEKAVKRQMPVLGICRGSQLFNVAFGGTLVPDIETSGHPSHSGSSGDRRHGVELHPGTTLGAVTGVLSGEVNSAHHQAIDLPGAGLCIAATSADGIVEAVEWSDPHTAMPVQLVQWHPERMEDSENPLAQSLILHFASTIQRITTT